MSSEPAPLMEVEESPEGRFIQKMRAGHHTLLADKPAGKIELEGDLTDAQRQRLLAIANCCPGHRTLTAGCKARPRLV